MNDDAQRLAWYGTAQPVAPARALAAGPWSALLIDGALHDIRYDGVEVLRAVSFLVRDRDWGTCRPRIEHIDIDETRERFHIRYEARCVNPDEHALDYTLTIDAHANGALAWRCKVTPQTDFVTARSGFCVLHPLDVAGASARVEHGDGRREARAFPQTIDPWQPFKDIAAIEHDLACGLTVRCAFTGDVFEMEDQRNWSDASFKTYSRPLELPWPYMLENGVTFEQTVTLAVTRSRETARRMSTQSRRANEQTIRIGTRDAKETLPAIGVAIAANETDAALENLVLLRELAPQQLTLSFDPLAGHGRAELAQFARLQRESGLPCVLEYPLPGLDAPYAELSSLAALIDETGLALSGIIVSPAVHRQSNPPGSISPPCPALDEVYRDARRVFARLRLGGGVLSYFTELNRKRPPLQMVDWVTHATCPIVHAADDRSVMQTLDAIPHITRSCRALIGEQPYSIGPVSIGMRQNPYGSRVLPNPRGERVAMAANDPRQRALFGAAWLVGYAAALDGARIETLTLGALTGERGLANPHGTQAHKYPMFEVAKALARIAGATRLRANGDNASGIACVAARDANGKLSLIVANLTSDTRTVRLRFDDEAHAQSFTVRAIDESWPTCVQEQRNHDDPITLRAYACAIASTQ